MNPVDPEVLKGILQGVGRSQWSDKSAFMKACMRSYMQNKWLFGHLELGQSSINPKSLRVARSNWRVWQFFRKHVEDFNAGHLNTFCDLHVQKKMLLHPMIELHILQHTWEEGNIDYHGLAQATGDGFKELLHTKGLRWKFKKDAVFLAESIDVLAEVKLDNASKRGVRDYLFHLCSLVDEPVMMDKAIHRVLNRTPWSQLKQELAFDASQWVDIMVKLSTIEVNLANQWLMQICQLGDRAMLNELYQRFKQVPTSDSFPGNLSIERVIALLPPSYKGHLVHEFSQSAMFLSRAWAILMVLKMYYPNWDEQQFNFVIKLSRQFVEHPETEKLLPKWEQMIFHKIKPGTEDFLSAFMEKSLPKALSYAWEPLLRETLIMKRKIFQTMGKS